MARSDNSKGKNKIPSFITTRCSPHRLYNLVNSLSEQQKSYVRNHGFGGLLSIRKCRLPLNLLEWVLQYVETNISQIFITDGKVIPLDARLVHRVLGIPFGGKPVSVTGSDDRIAELKNLYVENGKGLKISQLIPRVIAEQSEEAFIRSFLMVVLACFLCPSASLRVNSNFLHALIDVGAIHKLDWSKFVLDYLFADIQKYKSIVAKRDIKKEQQSISVGGCLLFLAIVYFDNVDIGELPVSSDFPRIGVVGTDEFELLENIDQNKMAPNLSFGKRPFRHATLTPYYADVQLSLPYAPSTSPFDGFFEHVTLDSKKSKIPAEFNAILEKYLSCLQKSNQDIANQFLERIKTNSAELAVAFMHEVLQHVTRSQINSGTLVVVSHLSDNGLKVVSEEEMATTSDDGRKVVVQKEIAIASDDGKIIITEEEMTTASDGQKVIAEKEIAITSDNGETVAIKEEMATTKDDQEIVVEEEMTTAINDGQRVVVEEEMASAIDDGRKVVTEEEMVAGSDDVPPTDSCKNDRKRKDPKDADAECSPHTCDQACKRLKVTDDQENIYNDFSVKCDKDEVVVEIGGMYLPAKELRQSMSPGGHVTTLTMIFASKVLMSDWEGSTSKFIVSCQTTPLLLAEENAFQLESVVKDVSVENVPYPLTEYDLIFLPILQGEHWFVYAVNLLRQQIDILDPINDVDSTFHISIREKVVENFARAFKVAYPTFTDDVSTFPFSCPSDALRQTNLNDCGIFVMRYMDCYDGQQLTSFSPLDIPAYRKVLTHHWLHHPKNVIRLHG